MMMTMIFLDRKVIRRGKLLADHKFFSYPKKNSSISDNTLLQKICEKLDIPEVLMKILL